MDLVDERQLAGPRTLPLALPAVQLAGDVVLLLAELGEADRVGVDVVDRHQGVDDAVADGVALVLLEVGLDLGAVAQDRAGDELHHVEGGAVDLVVVAEARHRRHRDRGLGEGGDDEPLAAHVVRGAEPLAERRAPQGPAVAGRVTDAVGQVRAPAGDALVGERRGRSVDVLLEPRLERRGVDPLRRRVGAGLGLRVASLLRHRGEGSHSRLRRRPDDQHLARVRGLLRVGGAGAGRGPRAVPRRFRGARAPARARDRRAQRGGVRAALRGAARGRRQRRPDHPALRRARSRRGDDRDGDGGEGGGPQDRPDLELLGPRHLRARPGRPLRRGDHLRRGRAPQAAARDLPARLRAARGRAG